MHPNAWGEYQIAQAFSKALISGYGIGNTPVELPAQDDPSLVRDIGTPQNFELFASPQGVTGTWDAGKSISQHLSIMCGKPAYSHQSTVRTITTLQLT